MHEKQFVDLIKENEGIIYKITHFYTDDEEDKKDLYQEIVYQLWKSKDTFKGKSKRTTWMYRVALNTAVTHVKKQKKQKTIAAGFQLPLFVEEYDTETERQLKYLHQQIGSLNQVEKAMVLLYLEGKTYNEIAAISGFTKTNVATKLSRIKEKMKKTLND